MSIYPTGATQAGWLALVRGAWPAVFDAQRPERQTRPYVVVWPLSAAQFDGPVRTDLMDADAWPTVQLTYWGDTREQVDALRDRVRPALLGQSFTAGGYLIGPVRMLLEQQTRRDDDVTPALYQAVDQFRAYATPA